MNQTNHKIVRLSFRDPDGFVCNYKDNFYRVVFQSYALDFEQLQQKQIINHPLLVPHDAINADLYSEIIAALVLLYDPGFITTIFTILAIKKIPFITYPWEWTPTQLKEAALCTLSLQRQLIPLGLTLKDATFYNIQFIGGKPYFIDLLSIKRAEKAYPWHPYGQFLRKFVYPLLLIKYKLFTNLKFLAAFPDGFNKNEIASLLPIKSRFSLFCLLNVFLLKRLSDGKNGRKINPAAFEDVKAGQNKALQLIDYVGAFIRDIRTQSDTKVSVWNNYYNEDVSNQYHLNKHAAITEIIENIGPINRAIDLGANIGEYSKLLCKYADAVLSIEFDETCCDEIVKTIQIEQINNWQVANVDLVNPTGGIGWMSRERLTTMSRIKGDFVCALAIIHHFFFTNRKGFQDIVDLFNGIASDHLIVEFVDIDDEKVMLINNLEGVVNYSMEEFIAVMNCSFKLLQSVEVSETRTLLLFRRTKASID